MKTPPKVGQTLYSLNIGNAARHSPQVLTPVSVNNVGRKYFTVKHPDYSWRELEYHLEDWREKTDYSPNSALYGTPKDWEDEKEASEILDFVWKKSDSLRRSNTLSIETLRAIRDLLSQP